MIPVVYRKTFLSRKEQEFVRLEKLPIWEKTYLLFSNLLHKEHSRVGIKIACVDILIIGSSPCLDFSIAIYLYMRYNLTVMVSYDIAMFHNCSAFIDKICTSKTGIKILSAALNLNKLSTNEILHAASCCDNIFYSRLFVNKDEKVGDFHILKGRWPETTKLAIAPMELPINSDIEQSFMFCSIEPHKLPKGIKGINWERGNLWEIPSDGGQYILCDSVIQTVPIGIYDENFNRENDRIFKLFHDMNWENWDNIQESIIRSLLNVRRVTDKAAEAAKKFRTDDCCK